MTPEQILSIEPNTTFAAALRGQSKLIPFRLGFASAFSRVRYLSNRYERRRAPYAICAAISLTARSLPSIPSIKC